MWYGGPTQLGITETNPFGCSSFYITSKVGCFICKHLCDALRRCMLNPIKPRVVVQVGSDEQVQCVTSLLEMLSSNHPTNILFSFLFLRFNTRAHAHAKNTTQSTFRHSRNAPLVGNLHICAAFIFHVLFLKSWWPLSAAVVLISLLISVFRCGCPLMLVCFHTLSLLTQVTLLGCLSCKKAG